MAAKRFTALVATTSLVITIVLGGLLMSSASFGISRVHAEENTKMTMTMETLYIFEDGTIVHMGPFEIPCHYEEPTERGLVVVPDYSPPSL